MKKISAIAVVILLSVQVACVGQIVNDTIRGSIITSYRLLITTGKTTNLVFPYAIRSADRGSGDVIAQQVKGIENILQVKAGVKNFAETNLTVITSDGGLYSFLVNYSPDPKELNIRFSRDTVTEARYNTTTTDKSPVSFSDAGSNMVEAERNSKILLENKKRNIHGVKDSKYAISVRLLSIHVKQNILYYQLALKNSSNLNYDVEMIRFFIRDKKRAKRSATQATELMPLYIAGNQSLVKAHSKGVCVFAFEKFTIPDAKYFVCEIMEKNGGRNLSIKIRNSHIIRAHMISGD